MADVLTQVGEEYIVDQIDGTNNYYMAWGTGAGTAVKGSTALFTEASETRVLCTKSQPAADQLQLVATITATGPKTITNFGPFTQTTGGTLVTHSDHGGIAIDSPDSIQYTVVLEIA